MRAGAYAAGLARRQDATLLVVHVVSGMAMAGLVPGAIGVVEATLDENAQQIQQQVEWGAAHAGVRAQFRAARGDAYTELSRIADEVRADAVVVGASASAGHRIVGSLAVRLVRAGRWPVTVVP